MKGGKDPEGSNGRNKLNYLDVPLLARVTAKVANINPFVIVGPSINFRLSAKDSDGNDLKDDFKAVDFGIVFGGGVQLTQMIAVEARFEQSVFDAVTDTGRKNFGIANEVDKKVNLRSIAFLVDVSLGKHK
jgi:hypothetical protein